MALLLNIDTATEHAGVCLAEDEKVLALQETYEQKSHASFIQLAIKQVMADAGKRLRDIDAVAISAGPGSYTGLRVGLATAKGLCYALHKPLIMISSLEIMALASIIAEKSPHKAGFLFCPMIDARRMEVFTALYNAQLDIVMPPVAIILDETSFGAELAGHTIAFSGSGSKKAQIITHQNAVFSSLTHSVSHMTALSTKAYKASLFADLAYSEPFYLKEFYKPIKKN
ncbi:MAG TPA: tRNA (adenosine(37)-N6)-threonylcarbamoyltransferase complex dimerization subunit type 1 TsaB [Chitinophagaceae bacterium]|nr:tRNA (adenosine(37)-N6)-threonylcarbamoyltransferase complex dimerization subunit type 1 TsaB [Chitinophagaceae bacterium]